MKWTIGGKLGMAFASILLLMAISTGISTYYNQLVFTASGHVVDEQYPSMTALKNITIFLYKIRVDNINYVLSQNDEELENAKKSREEYDRNLLSYLSLPLSEEEWQVINKFSPPVKKYFKILDAASAAIRSNPDDLSAALKILNELEMLKDEVEPILENLHKYKEIETNKMVDELRTNTQTSSTVSLTIGIIAIIAGFVLSFLLGRRMSRPIVELTKAADAISLGNFSNAVTAKTKDEIGELAIAIERMRTSLQKAMDRLRRRK